MTKHELNRDVAKLYRTFEKKFSHLDKSVWYEFIASKEYEDELRRLFYADQSMSSLSRLSLHKIITMNRMTRTIPFHVFLLRIKV